MWIKHKEVQVSPYQPLNMIASNEERSTPNPLTATDNFSDRYQICSTSYLKKIYIY